MELGIIREKGSRAHNADNPFKPHISKWNCFWCDNFFACAIFQIYDPLFPHSATHVFFSLSSLRVCWHCTKLHSTIHNKFSVVFLNIRNNLCAEIKKRASIPKLYVSEYLITWRFHNEEFTIFCVLSMKMWRNENFSNFCGCVNGKSSCCAFMSPSRSMCVSAHRAASQHFHVCFLPFCFLWLFRVCSPRFSSHQMSSLLSFDEKKKKKKKQNDSVYLFFGWQLRCISWQWNRRAAVPFFVTLYNWLNHKWRRTDKVFHRLYEMTIWRKEMLTKRKWKTFAFRLWVPLSSILSVLPNLNQ